MPTELIELVDGVRSFMAVQVPFDDIRTTLEKFGVGILVGAIFAYVVQRSLDGARLRRIQRGLCRAVLQQVTDFVAETRSMQASLAKHGPGMLLPHAKDLDSWLKGAISKKRFDDVAAWCWIIVLSSEQDPSIRVKLGNMFLWMNKTAVAMEERLSALKISGKDMADFPDSAIGAYVAVQRALFRFRVAFEALATTYASNPESLDTATLQSAWLAVESRNKALDVLREAMMSPSGTPKPVADRLLKRRTQEINAELEEVISRAQWLGAARDAVIEAAPHLGLSPALDESLPWAIMHGFVQIRPSSTDKPRPRVAIASADGETVIAQAVTPEHARMIVRAINAMFHK